MRTVNWRSRRSMGLLLVLALAAGAGVTWWLTRPDAHGERVDGPHGAYPSSGTGAPAAPGRLVRQVDDAVAVVGGLSFHQADENDKGAHQGLLARNLRTGKTYWHYRRDGKSITTVRVADGTAVLRYRDGMLVAVDVRSGEPRWRHALPEDPRSGDKLWTANGVVVASAKGEFTAFDLTTGKRSWTPDVPARCRLDGVLFAVGSAFGFRAVCDDTSRGEGVVLGVDARRGTVRWRFPNWMGGPRYSPLTDHTVFAPHWNSKDRAATIDVSGAEPVIRTAPSPDLAWDGADHTAVTTTFGKEGTRWRDDNVLRARDTRNGHVQWTRHAPRDRRFGRTLVADGRVYVVEQPQESRDRRPVPGPVMLLVLDLANGKTLYSDVFPPPAQDGEYDETLDPWAARDGFVAITWQGAIVSPGPADLTVLGG